MSISDMDVSRKDVKSDLSCLPVELVGLVLHFASGINDLCENDNDKDII